MKDFVLLAAMIGLTASAQELKMPTMAELTPGHPDYIYTKSLLATSFDDKGEFHYTLPDQAASAPVRPRGKRGIPSADGLWRAENRGDRLWVTGEGSSIVTPEGIATMDLVPLELEVSDPDAKSDNPEMGQSEIVWGQSVHRNEFGINGGIFWSPVGHKLAFYRMDQSMVGQYPLMQTDPREAEIKWVRYPMAGMTSHQVTLGVYNPDTRTTVYMKTNEQPANGVQKREDLCDPEHYLTCVTWRPDGKQIFIAELNRKQNYMELNVYDAETGDFVKNIFSEESAKYVEPENELYFLPGSNDRFIWQSERDGYNHAYLYDLSRNVAPVQITSGNWMITNLMGADPKAQYLYFMATKDSPIESNLYSVKLPAASAKTCNAKPQRITKEAGVHRIMHNKQYTQFYDTYSNHDTPRVCQLLTVKGGKTVKTEVLYTAENPYKEYVRPRVSVGTLKAADGETDLYYRLVTPQDLSKNYPVIVYLYNGPHAQLVTEGLDYGLPGWDCYMANKGYVVFTIDGRGSANRGRDFEQAIWHNLGYNEGKDQMKGIEFLKTLPYVDANRIGIYGWSYGGFMTTYMMLNYNETFKVGVCGGPVLDWARYEVMYGERYMGTPEDNPEGYAANTLINQTDKLKGHLLIIHDDQDATVVPQISMQFLKNSVATGTYPDYMLYMNHEHNVRGKDRVHLLNRIAQYIIDHL